MGQIAKSQVIFGPFQTNLNWSLGRYFFTIIGMPCMVIFYIIKAELPQEGILFRTQFPSLGIFINKKVGNQKKTKTTYLVYNF